jgi:hypothetical protein
MTKREPLLKPELDMKVFHEEIYDGNELMTVVGIRKDSVELEGDYSGGTNRTIGKEWFPITGLFRVRKVCHEVEQRGSCQLHNLHCGYPNCEPYLTGTHHYEKGVRIDY